MPAEFRGRGAATTALVLAHLAVAWALSAALVLPLLAPLGRHPDGVFALYREGGRILGELASDEGPLRVAALAGALVAALYGLAWMLLGGLLPTLAVVEPAPALHRAASYSLRRLPTLAALAITALLGYALAGVTGWLAHMHFRAEALRIADVRRADLREWLPAALPALAIAALVTVWHDLARVSAMGSGRGVLPSTADGVAWMLRMPMRTLGAALGYVVVGALGPLVAYVASRFLGARPDAASWLLLTAVQQLALAWRFGWRAGWFYHLGAVYRARAVVTGASSGDRASSAA